MDKEELLNLYLEKLRVICLEKLSEKGVSDDITVPISVIEALKSSIVYLEGEMQGY